MLAVAFLICGCGPDSSTDQPAPCDGVTVDDGIDCTVDSCNPTTGVVTHTGQDSMCSDGTDCTADTCGATGCVHAPNDIMCDDGTGCTTDTCGASGCVHTPNDNMCSDSASCTTDTCAPGVGADPTTGCKHVVNDSVCSDSASCSTDTCAPGVGADPTTGCKHVLDDSVCSDSATCSTDSCAPGVGADPTTGCKHVLNDNVCGDSINCTTDACAPGGNGADGTTGCTHVTVNSMCEVDGKSCTVPTCSATTGCSEAPNDALCNDNASCTTDVCSATGPGATGCVVTPNNAACTDAAECSTDACAPGTGGADPTTGCTHAQDMTVCDALATCSATFDCVCGPGYMGTGLACAGIPCAALSNPTNGTVAVSNLGNYPSTATYSCTTLGLSPSAVTRTCGTDGTWSGVDPTCDTSVFVARVGDGAAALSNSSTAVVLEERNSLSGALARTITLPTTAGSALTVSGTATTEGGLSRSTDGKYVVLGGYTAAPALAAIAATTAALVPRVVGRITGTGVVDVTTLLNAAFGGTGTSNAAVRGVSTADGTAFWVTGTAASTSTEPGGVHYVTLGSTGASTRVSGTNNNMRNTHVFAGQVYASSGSGAQNGVNTVGVGLPTTTGQTTALFAAAASPESFALLDLDAAVAGLDTLYVAIDAGGVANVLNVQKWTLDATGTWTRVTAFAPVYTGALAANASTRGLTAWSAADGVHVVATTSETALTKLVTFVDSGSNTPTVTVLATAPTNTGYRGVARSPDVAP